MSSKDQQWLLEEKYAGDQNAEGYLEDLHRLASGEPVAYVIGWQPFLGLKIYLDSKPLIPRPETEWWTEKMIGALEAVQQGMVEERAQRDGASHSNFPSGKYAAPKTFLAVPLRVLDLCAGSGAIGCALLSRVPNAEVHFGEIDPAHESTIQKNIRENNLDATRAHIEIGNLFAPFENKMFDFIAANPPYIPQKRSLEKSVADYEPALALFSDDDGLGLIRRIAKELPAHLSPNGQAWIECDRDNISQAKELFEMLHMHAEICSDQYGVPRLLVVSFP